MRLLIASPVSLDSVAGPATVGRELLRTFRAQGDLTRCITFSNFERRLPLGFRHVVFFLRALPNVLWCESVLLLDPASTGPALALAARILSRRSVLRVGGDFLWESYVERTKEPVLLSEFYTKPRTLSLRERFIRMATLLTVRCTRVVVFTTEWQRALWKHPYQLDVSRTQVISPVLPERDPRPATAPVFLSAHRTMRIKNGLVMNDVWKLVRQTHPEAILDTNERDAMAYQEALRNCYAVIVPSLSEVSPNVVFEAIRYGKPFIATRDTGIFEEFKDVGIFVDTRDPEAIAHAVTGLLDATTYQNACARLEAFTVTRTWKEVASAFRSALGAVS